MIPELEPEPPELPEPPPELDPPPEDEPTELTDSLDVADVVKNESRLFFPIPDCNGNVWAKVVVVTGDSSIGRMVGEILPFGLRLSFNGDGAASTDSNVFLKSPIGDASEPTKLWCYSVESVPFGWTDADTRVSIEAKDGAGRGETA